MDVGIDLLEELRENVTTKRQRDADMPITLSKSSDAFVKPLPHAIANLFNYEKVSPNYRSFFTSLN